MSEIVRNDTCFAAHARFGVPCDKRSCRNWYNSIGECNCVLVGARRKSTLNEIGIAFNLTRMRICQIEKKARAGFAEKFADNAFRTNEKGVGD